MSASISANAIRTADRILVTHVAVTDIDDALCMGCVADGHELLFRLCPARQYARAVRKLARSAVTS